MTSVSLSIADILLIAIAIGASYKITEAALDRLIAPVVLQIAPKSVVRIYDGLKRRDYRDDFNQQ